MEKPQTSWFDKNWQWFIPVLLVSIFAIVIGPITLGVFHLMKSSDIYQLALHEVKANDEAKKILGEPIEPGWYVTGNIRLNEQEGAAQLSIPVAGTLQEGTLQLDAIKKDGQWTFNSLILKAGSDATTITIH